MKKVIIEVYSDGSSKIDAEGFKGKTCSLATKELELALAGPGGSVDDKKKPEFYQSITGSNTQAN